MDADTEIRTLREEICTHARELGFDAVGFARAETSAEDKRNLARFVERGLHGEMSWMKDTLERRADPRVLWPQARTVIALGVNYGPDRDPLSSLAEPDRGTVSVYARNRDYHDVVKKRLKRLGRWIAERGNCEVKVFVDTAPVMEGPLAAAAGLGWIGKHTNLVSRDFGSWLFLGEVFTTLELPPDPPGTDLCGTCTLCLEACPTDALTAPYRIDARRCISYLTIESKRSIPEDLGTAMGNRIYGCDDCLAVCPWNKFAVPTGEPAFKARAIADRPRLRDLLALDDAEFRAAFAGSPVKRIKRENFLRNVLIAAGNSGDPDLSAAVAGLADDSSATVREAARWAARKLEKK